MCKLYHKEGHCLKLFASELDAELGLNVRRDNELHCVELSTASSKPPCQVSLIMLHHYLHVMFVLAALLPRHAALLKSVQDE